ncbi:hypothetical protein BOSEA31B_13089 [Hyphomicrobiales bacterium]|nr:hypothetical protein BOSEA31B_13089 [Hyphomicrobiales bacterium]CAH1698862.1 hypothetical protein BOSEA1005_11915 [Hyphomicrobiales bacterium]CAI0342506.1 hypothetical protein BO1005MUT1_190019 [Hyphomicrobiales bacterium]
MVRAGSGQDPADAPAPCRAAGRAAALPSGEGRDLPRLSAASSGRCRGRGPARSALPSRCRCARRSDDARCDEILSQRAGQQHAVDRHRGRGWGGLRVPAAGNDPLRRRRCAHRHQGFARGRCHLCRVGFPLPRPPGRARAFRYGRAQPAHRDHAGRQTDLVRKSRHLRRISPHAGRLRSWRAADMGHDGLCRRDRRRCGRAGQVRHRGTRRRRLFGQPARTGGGLPLSRTAGGRRQVTLHRGMGRAPNPGPGQGRPQAAHLGYLNYPLLNEERSWNFFHARKISSSSLRRGCWRNDGRRAGSS